MTTRKGDIGLRLRALWGVVCGRPTIYRCHFTNGIALAPESARRAVVVGNVFTDA